MIPVRLYTPLSSKTNRPGDRFTATVKYGRDDAGMPEGTRVEGVVREAIPSGNGKPGVLDIDFTRVVFPSGNTKTLDASLISLDSDRHCNLAVLPHNSLTRLQIARGAPRTAGRSGGGGRGMQCNER